MSDVPLMEVSAVKTEWEQPSANPLEGKTQEDINKLLQYRSELLMQLSEHYIALTKAIYALPIHVIFRQHAFLFLDTAEQWAKKGIDNVWDLPNQPISDAPENSPEEQFVMPPSIPEDAA